MRLRATGAVSDEENDERVSDLTMTRAQEATASTHMPTASDGTTVSR